MKEILTILMLLLSGAKELWKFFSGKAKEREERRKEAMNEVKEGLKEGDRSRITAGFGRLNRLR